MAPDWAVLACKAYNTWLYEKFLSKNSRLRGVALIPFQDIDAAILRITPRGQRAWHAGRHAAVQRRSDSRTTWEIKIYWPLYEEAEKLGCALAVHVGCLSSHRSWTRSATYYPVHALGHPFSSDDSGVGHARARRIRSLPNLRVAFLEGGATWVPFSDGSA